MEKEVARSTVLPAAARIDFYIMHEVKRRTVKPQASKNRATLLLSALLACAVIAGCNRGPTMHRVRGQVFYKDGSVPKGAVAAVGFRPTKDSMAAIRKGASGTIEPDGSFEMFTSKAGDGVHQGEYDVTFTVMRNMMDANSSLVLPKYTNPATSGYNNIKVDRNISDLKFEIEPIAGAPKN
jgi:hypothetical protein